VRSALYFSIWYKLKEANIEVPFPQRDLHVRDEEIRVRINSPLRSDRPEGSPGGDRRTDQTAPHA
jgi:small-conductance mechanosensitive channel